METVFIKEQKTGDVIENDTIEKIAQEIVKHFNPEKIILFGSYAIGIGNPDSDVDFLIIMQTDLPHQKRSIQMQLLFRPMPCSIDFLVFTPAEINHWNGTPNHIITEAMDTGKVLYEKQ